MGKMPANSGVLAKKKLKPPLSAAVLLKKRALEVRVRAIKTNCYGIII
jgi:hypothetical protein